MLRIFVRSCSSSASKAEWKISWNTANKQLFGAVEKKKRAKKIKSNPEATGGISIVKDASPKTPEPILSSEMHWLLGPAQNRRRMLSRPYDNTERVALKVKNRAEKGQQPPNKGGFDAILKVPLMFNHQEENGSSASHAKIPELEFNELPSVGKILQATMSDAARNALIKWKLSKIEELGEDGFAELQKHNLSRGLRFHNMLQDYFTADAQGEGDEEEKLLISEDDPNYLVWQSVQSVLPEVDKQALFVEQRVKHPILRYKGVVDCVSSIGNNIYCIEWKNSEKTKSTLAATFDAPLQMCAYLGALNASPEHNVRISSGMVVVAYQSGRPADYFKLDEGQLNRYWYAWLLRVQEYWIRHRDGTLPEPIF